MKKTDVEDLRLKIRNMSRYSYLYEMLKDELGLRGNWRNRARGDASKGGNISKHGKDEW